MNIFYDLVVPVLADIQALLLLLLSTLIAYWLGILSYREQRVSEAIRERYLVNTLDLYVSHVEQCLSTIRMNWLAGLAIARTLRDAREHISTEGLTARISKLDHSALHIAAAYRMGVLLNGNTCFYSMQQMLVALADRSAIFLADDLIGGIAFVKDGRIPPTDINLLYDRCMDELRQISTESQPFYRLLVEAQTIAHEFERSHYSYWRIRRFYRKKHVREAVERVEIALKPLLPEGKGQSSPSSP